VTHGALVQLPLFEFFFFDPGCKGTFSVFLFPFSPLLTSKVLFFTEDLDNYCCGCYRKFCDLIPTPALPLLLYSFRQVPCPLPLASYGIPCVQKLFSLISLIFFRFFPGTFDIGTSFLLRTPKNLVYGTPAFLDLIPFSFFFPLHASLRTIPLS